MELEEVVRSRYSCRKYLPEPVPRPTIETILYLALITTEEDLGVYGAVDCGLYVANFMLAAQNMGVAAIAQAALASYPDFIRDHFGLPPNRKLVCGISFGYADADHPINGYRTGRSAVSEAVTFVE